MATVAHFYGKQSSATDLASPTNRSSSSVSSATAQKRPLMRRKSSASNLLSSFKSNPSTTPSGYQTPTSKDWDAQSIYSEASNVPTISSVTSAPPLPPGQSSSVDYLRELVRKRLSTLQYLKNIHSGQSHWLSTVLITRADLERTFTTNIKKQRTYRFAILGMSLSNLFEIQSPQDFLRSLLALLQEFDSVPEDTLKPKMRNLFRGSKLPKKSGAGDYTAYLDPDASYLVSPHIPFQLDYFQVSFAFFDVLAEVYKRFANMLGPSHLPPPNNIGPSGFGLIPPTPMPPPNGSSLVQSPTSQSDSRETYFNSAASGANNNERPSPLGGVGAIGIAGIMPAISIPGGSSHGLQPLASQPASLSGHPGSPPPAWNPAYADMLNKVDAKFMRIITSILKKVDETARNRIREELASLSPLLQNMSPGGAVGYDYDDR
ncbi:hypothetical protein FRB99_006477 [Tulasnella sp. 403]|nr:hypothetical protein FRB99_006477 [Tulasnella sp. 403]